jgi:hypothetical protein
VAPSAGASLSANGPQLFIVRTSDPDGDPYAGWVTVTSPASGQAVATFATSPASSGQDSSGTPFAPLPPGNYTWTAAASDLPSGQRGPQASPQSFSVAGSPDIGGGAFTGNASYAPPLPAVGQPCAPTGFSVAATSAAAVVSFAPTQFVGFINFSGSGGSGCETSASGSGTLTLSASGLGATATTISCATLTGGYTRTGMHLRAVVSGPCAINGWATDTVTFAIDAQLVPDGTGGLTAPVTNAALDGAFVVSPAA